MTDPRRAPTPTTDTPEPQHTSVAKTDPRTPAPQTTGEAKSALRRGIRTDRRTAPPDPGRPARLAAQVLSHPEVARRLADPGAVAAVYVGLPWEPPTDVLRERLRAAGVAVLLPVANPPGGLTWVRDDGGAGAAWGVPGQPAGPPVALTADDDPLSGLPPASAPQARDASRAAVVLLPALAATRDGQRLGQGGGYYDRFLADLPMASAGGPLLVALVGPGEVLAHLPTEPHDRRVDVVVVA